MKKILLAAALVLLSGCSNFVDLDQVEAVKAYCEDKGGAANVTVKPFGQVNKFSCRDAPQMYSEFSVISAYYIKQGTSK